MTKEKQFKAWEKLNDIYMRRQDIMINGLDVLKQSGLNWGDYSDLMREYESLGLQAIEIKKQIEIIKNLSTSGFCDYWSMSQWEKENNIPSNLTLWKMSKGLKLTNYDKTEGVKHLIGIEEKISKYTSK